MEEKQKHVHKKKKHVKETEKKTAYENGKYVTVHAVAKSRVMYGVRVCVWGCVRGTCTPFS